LSGGQKRENSHHWLRLNKKNEGKKRIRYLVESHSRQRFATEGGGEGEGVQGEGEYDHPKTRVRKKASESRKIDEKKRGNLQMGRTRQPRKRELKIGGLVPTAEGEWDKAINREDHFKLGGV